MRQKNLDKSVLMSSKLVSVLALALLVVAVELGVGETNSWFFLGLNILEWTNPLEEVRLIGDVTMESMHLLFSSLDWLFGKLSGFIIGAFVG